MPEKIFFAGFAVLFVMALSWLVSLYWLFRHLRIHHAPTYEALGSPTLFWNNSPCLNWVFLKFLFRSQWKTLNDPLLITVCRIMRVFICAYLLLFLALFAAFVAGAPFQPSP